MRPVRLTLASALVAQLIAGAAAINAQDAAREYLSTQFQLAPSDCRTLDQRRPVVRTLETVDGREIATFGAIRIGVPSTYYVEQLRNIVGFKVGEAVLQIGAFSSPARVEDMSRLSLDARDVESLQRCRPGKCDVQLSTEALRRFQEQVPWQSAGATAVADQTMREVLVDLVNGYRAAGDAGLMTYVDARRPLSLAEEFRSMVASRPAVLQRFPDLHRHVLEFPSASPSVEDIVYWSKEKMGPVVILSVTHLAIASLETAPTRTFAAASKQIYGSHYFDSSLGVTILVDAGLDDSAGAYLVYVNRSRIDALGGFWGGVKRAVVRSQTRSSMTTSLIEARDLVETRFQMQQTAARR